MRKIYLLLIGSLLGFNSYSQNVPANGLVAYYAFTGNTITDGSANSFNLIDAGTNANPDRFGSPINGRYFNGGATTFLYRVANGTDLAVTGNSITISFWYKTSSVAYKGFIDNSSGADSYGIDNYNGNMRFIGGGNFSAPIFSADNHWHHVVFTKNGTKGIFYNDGIASDSIDTMTPITSSSANQTFYIGRRNVSGATNYTGFFDDIAIYNRTLSASEVSAIYKYNDWSSVPTTGLIGNYPFSSNGTVDVSPNGKDLSNSVTVGTADRFGVVGNARNFSGASNSCLYRTNGNDLAAAGSKVSISFWYKTASAAYAGFIDNVQGTNSYGIDNFGGNFRFLGGGNFSAPIFNSDNQWHHIVFTKSGSKGIFYKDGVATDSTNVMTAVTAATGAQQFNVGRKNVFNSYYTGVLDDIAIYYHTLSPAEVDGIYHYNGWPGVATKTNEIIENEVFSIYPNPANEILNIELKNWNESSVLQLADISGRIVMEEKILVRTTQLNISALNSGVYFLTVITEKGQSIHKIIKQ